MTMNITISTNTELVCEACGQLVTELFPVTAYMGRHEDWCEECRNEGAHQCDRCGEWFEDDLNTVVTTDGCEVEWCDECRDEHAPDFCEHCGRYAESGTREVITGHHYHWGTYNDTEEWCENCIDDSATTCFECGEPVSDDEIAHLEMYDGNTVGVCHSCADEYYRECYECGNYVHIDDTIYDNDYCYCPDCNPTRVGDNIHHYHHTDGRNFWLSDLSHKYSWELSHDEKKELYLGLELEVSDCCDRNELADSIIDEYGEERFICKLDSTLGNRGVEIVSQPMTPLYHLNSGIWERITELAKNNGALSYDSGKCGMHIHVSRAALKHEDAVYRIDRLMHHFKRQMIKFSRRTNTYWCEISDDFDLREIESIDKRKKEWHKKKEWDDCFCKGHHVALNDENSATVEYRLWRGSLNINTVRATIEFTAGMTIVADTISDEMADGLTWKMFKMLVRYALEAANIPHDDLDEYFVRRGL